MDYIEHYGVPGMKWGVRKSVKKSVGRAVKKKYEKEKTKLKERGRAINRGSIFMPSEIAAPLRIGFQYRGDKFAGAIGGMALTAVGASAAKTGGYLANRYIQTIGGKPASSLYYGSKALNAIGTGMMALGSYKALVEPELKAVYNVGASAYDRYDTYKNRKEK